MITGNGWKAALAALQLLAIAVGIWLGVWIFEQFV